MLLLHKWKKGNQYLHQFEIGRINVFEGLFNFNLPFQHLTVSLYCNSEKIGTLDLELFDFLSDKVIKREYYKMFSGKALAPIPLKWGLNVTIFKIIEK